MRESRASEILESDETPKDEIALAKKRGGRWTEIPSKRRTGKVSYLQDDLEKITGGGPYSALHTHPRLENNTVVTDIRQIEDDSMVAAIEAVASMSHANGNSGDSQTAYLEKLVNGMRFSPSFPSDQDILFLLGDPKQKFLIVAQRDPVTSKVAGYYFVMKRKNTPSIPRFPGNNDPAEIKAWHKNSEVKKMKDFFNSTGYNSIFDFATTELATEQKTSNQKVVNEIMKELDLKVRYIPARGYKYDEGFGFKKINNS